jgi:hypothetical protein
MSKRTGMNTALDCDASSRPLPPTPEGRGRATKSQVGKEIKMLEVILIVLVILWALGFFAFHVGGVIHALLVIALIVFIIRMLQGRRVL